VCRRGRGRLCDDQRVAAHTAAAGHAAAEHVVPVGLAGQPFVIERTTVVVRQRTVCVGRTAVFQWAAVVHGDVGVGIIRRVRVDFGAVSGRTGAATLANAALAIAGPTRGTEPGARQQREHVAGWRVGRCSGQRGRIQRVSRFCQPAGRRRRLRSSDRRGSPRADRPPLRRDVRRVR